MFLDHSRIVRKAPSTRTKINKAVVESLETRKFFSAYSIDHLTLGGIFDEVAALNEAGQVAGDGYNADGSVDNAFLFTDLNNNNRVDANEVLNLGTLGGTAAVPTLLNEAGQVAGYSFTAGNNSTHAFLFTDRNGNHALDSGEMLDLGSLGGITQATLLNNAGQVAGMAESSNGDTRAFLFTDANNNGAVDAGEMADLGTLGGANAQAVAMNQAGQVAGNADTGSGDTHAFLYTDRNGNKHVDAGEMLDLGTLGGSSSFATGMNASGQVIGYSYTAGDAEIHAFVFTDANSNGQVDPGEMQDLGTFGGTSSQAQLINDAGQVTGFATTADESSHAFIYTDANHNGQVDAGEVADIGTLSGTASTVVAMNQAGQVTGYYESADGGQRAFLYTDANHNGLVDAGEVADLGTLGGIYSLPSDLTEDGRVVGFSSDAGDTAVYAFIYTDANHNGQADAGELQDLNHLIPADSGWVLEQPMRINEAGDIVGVGYLNGELSPFLATVDNTTPPTQDPATIADLDAAVQSLVTEGGLASKQAKVLLDLIGKAQDKLDAGKTNTALNLLNAFSNKLDSLYYSNRLSEEDYDSLKALLDEVIANLV